MGRLTQTLILNLAVVLYFLGFAAALAFIIAGGLSRRVADLIIAMDRLIDGDIRVAVPHLADRNETGHIARTVEAFKQSLIEGERLREEARAQTASAETARATAEAERARVVRFLSVGEMASSIAHEINQPIAAIVAGGAAARRWLERETPNVARARQAIDRIVRDAGRAGAVIARIRQVLGKNAPIFLRIDVNQAVQEAMEFTERERSLARIATRLDLAPGLPPVRGDRVQLQQVIINLTLNGVDAMIIRARQAPCRLFGSHLAHADGGVLVSVADSGAEASTWRRRAPVRPSTPPSRPAWASASPSPAPSSPTTAERSGPRRARTAARCSASRCRFGEMAGTRRICPQPVDPR